MPIYEYQCQACHHELEKIQKLSDSPIVECPSCHQNALKKKISAAGFRLSGSGWYETDFKKGNNKKNLVESASAPSTESKPAETKTSDSSGSGAGTTDTSSKPVAKTATKQDK